MACIRCPTFQFIFTAALAIGLASCKENVDTTSAATAGLNQASLSVTTIGSSGGTTVVNTSRTGYGYTSVFVDQGAQFLSTNICKTATIFGLTGTINCVSSDTLLRSQAFRSLGTTQLLQSAEVTTYAGSGTTPTLPTGYRDIPLTTLDDDGNNPSSGALSLYGLRPTTACGSSGSIPTRIADCATKNTTRATWDGSTQGRGGHSTWKLVFTTGNASTTCSIAASDCYEVWQDQRTGLVWSSNMLRTTLAGVQNGMSWCIAAGSTEALAAPSCVAGGTYQLATPASWCAENGTLVASPGYCNLNVGANITLALCGAPNWTANTENYATATYHAGKGYMGANSADKVKWRLPTRNDVQQAIVDGMKFVMPDMGVAGGASNRTSDGSLGGLGIGEWNSTFAANNPDRNWVIYTNGYQSRASRDESWGIRCVGR